MPRSLQEVKVKVRWFTCERRSYGGVELSVLKPSKEYESVEVGSPIEVLLSIIEKSSKSREGDYFEVRVEGQGVVEVMGENPRYKGLRMLYPRPARLKRIGVLTTSKLSAAKGGRGEYAVFKLDELEWHTVDDEVYVYEGAFNAAEEVIAVYLDTEEGPRVLIPSGRDSVLRDALSPPQSSGGSETHEPGQGEDSTPSS